MYNRRVSSNRMKLGDDNSNVQDLPAAEEIVAEAETHVADYPFGDDKTDEEKWEMIKKFELTPDEWSIDGGHLTPTMKMKRKIIKEIYNDLYERIYRG